MVGFLYLCTKISQAILAALQKERNRCQVLQELIKEVESVRSYKDSGMESGKSINTNNLQTTKIFMMIFFPFQLHVKQKTHMENVENKFF